MILWGRFMKRPYKYNLFEDRRISFISFSFFSNHEKKETKKNHRCRKKSEKRKTSLKHKTPPFTAAGCNVRQTTCVSSRCNLPLFFIDFFLMRKDGTCKRNSFRKVSVSTIPFLNFCFME